MSCSKECADLVTMFVEVLQGEWQSKYDLLESTWQNKLDMYTVQWNNKMQDLKSENQKLRKELEKHLSHESNKLFDIIENPDAESEVSDEEVEEPEIIEDVPTLME